MTSNADIYKKLPTTEEFLQIREYLEEQGSKIIIIDKTSWHNSVTRCKGEVADVPIIARKDNGDRPWAITSIHIQPIEYTKGNDGLPHNIDIRTSIEEGADREKLWLFNQYYSHTNISGDIDCCSFIVPDDNNPEDNDTEKIRTGLKIVIKGQAVCSPITQHHFYNSNLQELTLIFKGQLTGQNGNSAFQHVGHVNNALHDYNILDEYRHPIKRTASAAQLLLKVSADKAETLVKEGQILDLMLSSYGSVKKDYLFVKARENGGYCQVSKKEYETRKNNGEISEYYPIIESNVVIEQLSNLPKIEIDMACLGLGSAGTAILDQISRSTFFDKILLCDFDTVEKKNLRNQWYTRGNIGYNKVDCSSSILRKRHVEGSECQIICKNTKFQNAVIEGYDINYIVSAFDSIDARLELYNKIKDGEYTAKYLIDTRYDDLSSSILFIDLADEKQKEFYEKGLLQAKEVFDKLEEERRKDDQIKTFEDYVAYLKEKNVFSCNCLAHHYELDIDYAGHCHIERDSDGRSCGGRNCLEHFRQIWEEHKDKICSKFKKPIEAEVSSCVKQNFIDIYQYTATFVFGAIRAIADGKEKPFTAIECSTESLPTYMVLKK